MSAAPEYFMHQPSENPDPERRDNEKAVQTFWHWFAIGVLAFCWIAEASMCAERGF